MRLYPATEDIGGSAGIGDIVGQNAPFDGERGSHLVEDRAAARSPCGLIVDQADAANREYGSRLIVDPTSLDGQAVGDRQLVDRRRHACGDDEDPLAPAAADGQLVRRSSPSMVRLTPSVSGPEVRVIVWPLRSAGELDGLRRWWPRRSGWREPGAAVMVVRDHQRAEQGAVFHQIDARLENVSEGG